ncbi:acyl carrier protein [Streptomyces sp. RKND-216]|nr:acyl carrier protein [Streptomyces sp. RKND-216]
MSHSTASKGIVTPSPSHPAHQPHQPTPRSEPWPTRVKRGGLRPADTPGPRGAAALWEMRGRPRHREDAMTVAFNLLMQILMETFGLPKQNLHPDATFAELEMDSLSLTELSVLIEERTGLSVPPFPVKITLTEAADLIDDAADAYLDRMAAAEQEQQRVEAARARA